MAIIIHNFVTFSAVKSTNLYFHALGELSKPGPFFWVALIDSGL